MEALPYVDRLGELSTRIEAVVQEGFGAAPFGRYVVGSPPSLWQRHRVVASRRTAQELFEAAERTQGPARQWLEATARWVGVLAVARVTADARAERDGRASAAAGDVGGGEPKGSTAQAPSPARRSRTLGNGMALALRAEDVARAFDAWDFHFRAVRDTERRLRETRSSAVEALALPSLRSSALGVAPHVALGAPGRAPLAATLLDRTDDLAACLLREALRREGGDGTDAPAAARVAAWLCIAQGFGAPEGWPARLSPAFFSRALAEWVRHVDGRRLMGALPPALGGGPAGQTVVPHSPGSFARALGALGCAWARATEPIGAPLPLRRAPEDRAARLAEALFANLFRSEAFHRRALGVGSARAAQRRGAAAAALFTLRALAVRVLLTEADREMPDDERVGHVERLLGAPLPHGFSRAWPLARHGASLDIEAELSAFSLQAALRESLDEDWFHNPRAPRALEARLAQPAAEAPPHDVLVEALDRWIQQVERDAT